MTEVSEGKCLCFVFHTQLYTFLDLLREKACQPSEYIKVRETEKLFKLEWTSTLVKNVLNLCSR